MNKIFLIIKRELVERFNNRFYRWFMVLGPLFVLGAIYLFLSLTVSTQKKWDVLVMDKEEILDRKMASNPPQDLTFYFINAFVDYNEFAHLSKFEQYDLAVWINEKVISNKQVVIFYRKKMPPSFVQRKIMYIVERRMEEIMVNQFTEMSVADFRKIKQSLSFTFRDANDPENSKSIISGWVGFTFGGLILLFVFTFGMSILRSISKEKSNRVVEVILSSVKARQFLTGKVMGIGIAALIQFFIWVALIGGGLYLFRTTLFPDIFSGQFLVEQLSSSKEGIGQSPFVELIYEGIQYGNMLLFFLLFFLGGYLFYGSFFAMIGSSVGSESDGQQFIVPVYVLLLTALISGVYIVYNPAMELTTWLSFIPFTSPMAMMIKLANGFSEGTAWQLFLSLFILFVSSIGMMLIAGRIYKNGILHFNHRLRLRMLFSWMKKR